jgi:hypothetical protein
MRLNLIQQLRALPTKDRLVWREGDSSGLRPEGGRTDLMLAHKSLTQGEVECGAKTKTHRILTCPPFESGIPTLEC